MNMKFSYNKRQEKLVEKLNKPVETAKS